MKKRIYYSLLNWIKKGKNDFLFYFFSILICVSVFMFHKNGIFQILTFFIIIIIPISTLRLICNLSISSSNSVQVSHPYNTTCHISVFTILFYNFLLSAFVHNFFSCWMHPFPIAIEAYFLHKKLLSSSAIFYPEEIIYTKSIKSGWS